MRSKALRLAVLACVAIAIAGCDSDGAGEDVLFLTQAPLNDPMVVMEALYEGTVIVEDGCIRLGEEPDRHTVIWPSGFRYLARGDGIVLDRDGHRIGSLGSNLSLGGGEVPTLWESGPVDDSMRQEALERCPGRYWLVGEIPGR